MLRVRPGAQAIRPARRTSGHATVFSEAGSPQAAANAPANSAIGSPAGLLRAALHRGPGGEVAEDPLEVPRGRHRHRRHGDFFEREEEIGVAAGDERPLGRPVRLDGRVEFVKHRFHRGRLGNLEEIVGPYRYRAPRSPEPSHTFEESLLIEPVNRLTRGDEIDARVVEPGVLGGRHAVRHALARRRVRDLLGARVRRDDSGEVLREAAGRLSAPRPRVPAERVARDERGEGVEERGRVRRADSARSRRRAPRSGP